MAAARSGARASRSDDEQTPSALVWERPPRVERREPLSREAIVSTAIPLADTEGLAALTIRRLAAELGARPMSIYSYAQITSKEELFDLMVDQVCAQMLLPDLPHHWKQALRAIAIRTREVLLAHPWWVELIGHNVLLGPNGTRHREQTLAALSGLQLDPSAKIAIIVAIETYVVGQVSFAMDEQGSSRIPGRSTTQRQEAQGRYQLALIATGEFPNLATISPPQPTSQHDQERYFNLGLDWLLKGIAATVNPRRQRGAQS
jgi:AcrR family transcriptional regulator